MPLLVIPAGNLLFHLHSRNQLDKQYGMETVEEKADSLRE
jgi:hypothetical protein